MGALIRAARIGPLRTRLRTGAERTVEAVRPAPPPDGAVPGWSREAIESEVRQEMAEHMQALCDAERVRARTAGYADAFAQAREDAAVESARARTEQAAAVARVLAELAGAHARAMAQLQASVGEVSFAAVCRLLGAELGARSFAQGVVEQACAALRLDSAVTLRLHPRDVDLLAGLADDLARQLGAIGLRVVADEALALGGCVIESDSGEHDAGLESQLRRLHAVLTAPASLAAPSAGDARQED